MNIPDHFFYSGPFMPHGGCYLWTTSLIALHSVSDAFITLAYYSIPVTLVYFVRKRKDLKFHWMFILFAVFILACGTTHLMEIWNIWHANYWLSGIIKAITALASVPTAFLLVKLIPTLLALPSPSALEKARDELEQRVIERTRQLQTVNDDLTREMAARRRAEVAQVRLAAIVNSSDDAIVGKTLDGRITSWNPGAEKIFGYAAAEAIGQPITILFPPERLAEEAEILARITRGESTRNYETVRLHKNGRRVDVSVTASPIVDGAGKIVGASKIARDITERKRVQEALRASEERFRTMANSIPQLAWSARADGFITWYNQRWYEYTGTTPEQMEGWGWQRVHDPQRLPDVMAQWTKAIAGGEPFEMEFPLRSAAGKFHRFLTRTVPLKNDEGCVVQWFGTNTDVDDLKRAEDEIRKLNTGLEQRVTERTAQLTAANLELEAFSYSVSHDLRAPLRAVNGFAGIALEDFGPQLPAECRRYLERIREGGQRMGNLIDDLLSFARLTRQPIHRQPVDVNRLVQTALEELKPQHEGRPLEIRAADLPACYGDPGLLKQVWLNLLSNAIKYSRGRQPAIVEIGCAQENGETVYFVRDNGTGFDMRYADKLFGVFQRLHRADEFEGTGVGLAIVQRLVHRHGGKVWAEAKENHGATFHFTLEEETPS